MSKFTIDLEKKEISFHEPFTKTELEEVMSLLNIPETDTWKITMSENFITDHPPVYTPPTQPIYQDNTGTPWWTGPYIVSSTGGDDNNFTYTTGTTDLEYIYNENN